MTTGAYIARRMCIDPRRAEVAMADCQQRTFHAVPERRSPRTARLCLAAEPEADSLDPLLLFARRAMLWVGFWPVPVHLECTNWSATESELCLRPSRLMWPVGTEGYASAALAVLEEVAEALVGSCEIETQESTRPFVRIATGNAVSTWGLTSQAPPLSLSRPRRSASAKLQPLARDPRRQHRMGIPGSGSPHQPKPLR
jgi:hypothetical protein